MFSQLDIPCPLIPPDLDVTNIPAFNAWLRKDLGNYPRLPFTNHLKLFIWIVNDFCKLPNDL